MTSLEQIDFSDEKSTLEEIKKVNTVIHDMETERSIGL